MLSNELKKYKYVKDIYCRNHRKIITLREYQNTIVRYLVTIMGNRRKTNFNNNYQTERRDHELEGQKPNLSLVLRMKCSAKSYGFFYEKLAFYYCMTQLLGKFASTVLIGHSKNIFLNWDDEIINFL